MSTALRVLRVLNLSQSLSSYSRGLSLQETIVKQRKQNEAPDTVILLQVGHASVSQLSKCRETKPFPLLQQICAGPLMLQHLPTYTIGKRGKEADFKVPREASCATVPPHAPLHLTCAIPPSVAPVTAAAQPYACYNMPLAS